MFAFRRWLQSRLPASITGHCYAIFGYRRQRAEGDHLQSLGQPVYAQGPPGLANGYPTEHGQFTVPLDHLMQFVTQLVYETDKPLGK